MDRDVQVRSSEDARKTYAAPRLEVYGYVWEIATLGVSAGGDGQSMQA